MSNDKLIQEARSVLNRHLTEDGRLFGDVGAAILSSGGNVYTGVCVDTPTWGLCAERSAVAAMITNGEYQVKKVVAVWEDDKTGKLHILPPCGICREFLKNVDGANLKSEVILGLNESQSLGELLPKHQWPDPIE